MAVFQTGNRGQWEGPVHEEQAPFPIVSCEMRTQGPSDRMCGRLRNGHEDEFMMVRDNHIKGCLATCCQGTPLRRGLTPPDLSLVSSSLRTSQLSRLFDSLRHIKK